jgi:hypothetical protein
VKKNKKKVNGGREEEESRKCRYHISREHHVSIALKTIISGFDMNGINHCSN